MKKITIAITAASYSGNKGSAAMLQSSICQLREVYGSRLHIYLMSVYPAQDRMQCPHDFVTIIPAQPQRLLFLTLPCAVGYRLFSWCPPFRALFLKNRMVRAYAASDLVVDESGIAFSDSRSFVMNTYSFVCAAIPLLTGAPLVKYAQALGPFENRFNRTLAKAILPKAELVIARGRGSYQHLLSIGLKERARLYADGAFTMRPDEKAEQRARETCAAWPGQTVGCAVSSVVAKRCRKAGMDYGGIMARFLLRLAERGYYVWMFANAARTGSKKQHNNDLPIGDAICKKYRRLAPAHLADRLLWDRREMDAEEISACIARCRLFISSRFHAMVFALGRQVPVMLIGWGHKYQEVMEQFGLEDYTVDFSQANMQKLSECFASLERDQEQIRAKIARRLPAVKKSSARNVEQIVRILNRKKPHFMNHVIDLNDPDAYLGPHLYCKMGYALDSGIRANAASGGMVTALLVYLLKQKEIDGAWVVKTAFTPSGALTYQAMVATTAQQIKEASSSVYMKIPMLSHLDQLRQFDGKVAVVLTPCMMRAFCHILEREENLRKKIVMKIGLFCSGAHDPKATEYALDHCHIPRAGANRLYYRRGHWRGTSSVLYDNGRQADFSYTKSICAYKNAYFFIEQKCLHCQDQFAAASDLSFGDVWLPEVKKEPVKYTGCIVRTKKAHALLAQAMARSIIKMCPMSEEQMLRSQMRALTFKYRSRRWNHRLAGFLAQKNRRFSVEHPKRLKRIPLRIIYYEMCLIRLLLSW